MKLINQAEVKNQKYHFLTANQWLAKVVVSK